MVLYFTKKHMDDKEMINTERLILRPMIEGDFEDMFKIFSDKKVLNAFNLMDFSQEQMKGWIHRNLSHQDKYGYGLFSVVLKSNQKLIGDCGFEHTEFNQKPCVEIGYDFLSEYWNQGYATEAANAVKDFGTNHLKFDINSLCSFVRKSNSASQRVSEKIGMQKVKEYMNYNIKYLLYAFSTDFFN